MPLLPSHTLLQTYSLTLLLTSYILHTRPTTLLNGTTLWLLGESMHIRPATFTTPTQPTSLIQNPTIAPSTQELLSLLSFTLLLASLSQSILSTPLRYSHTSLSRLAAKSITTTTSVPSLSTNTPSAALEAEDSRSAFAEKLYNLHSTQTIFLTLSAVRVLLEGAFVAWVYLFYSTRTPPSSTASSSSGGASGILSSLANRVVFTIAMADMLFWGYIWTVLRDEAREVAGLVGKRRQLEEEMEQRER